MRRMTEAICHLGLGIGWRQAVASLVLRRPDLGFVEILAEGFPAHRPLPLALVEARRRGLAVVPHGVGLSLGGAERPDPGRLSALAGLAERVGAPLVSEHVAFVRAGGVEAGHLLPVPRSRQALEVLVENVRIALDQLPVPLALEPIASLFEWPDPELDESAFLWELVERTGVYVLLDVANVYANARNHGFDPMAFIASLPLDRLAYVHVAGGVEQGGLYHDTHAHGVPSAVLELLGALSARRSVPGALLERDAHFPPTPVLEGELDAIAAAARLAEGSTVDGCDRSLTSAALPSDHCAPSASRVALASAQAALVRALVAGGPTPGGFDPARLRATSLTLAAKSARSAPGGSAGGSRGGRRARRQGRPRN
jgi:uncharacterized protein (UPF0276 family)